MVSSTAMKRILGVLSSAEAKTVKEIASKTNMTETHIHSCLKEMMVLGIIQIKNIDRDSDYIKGRKTRKGYVTK